MSIDEMSDDAAVRGDYGECYCGDPLTLDHECYHWPPRVCGDAAEASIRLSLPFVRALWQDRQVQAARLAAATTALQTIHQQYGQVCERYELCAHASCASSYGAWATADAWLAARAAVRSAP